MNNSFRDYVTGQSFVLNLSRRQIAGLVHLSGAVAKRVEVRRFPIDPGVLAALHRRGLMEWKAPFTGPGSSGTWDQRAAVSRAGRLVLLLLVEAGLADPDFVAPMPPPDTEPVVERSDWNVPALR